MGSLWTMELYSCQTCKWTNRWAPQDHTHAWKIKIGFTSWLGTCSLRLDLPRLLFFWLGVQPLIKRCMRSNTDNFSMWSSRSPDFSSSRRFSIPKSSDLTHVWLTAFFPLISMVTTGTGSTLCFRYFFVPTSHKIMSCCTSCFLQPKIMNLHEPRKKRLEFHIHKLNKTKSVLSLALFSQYWNYLHVACVSRWMEPCSVICKFTHNFTPNLKGNNSISSSTWVWYFTAQLREDFYDKRMALNLWSRTATVILRSYVF